jgi:hypothetical protein
MKMPIPAARAATPNKTSRMNAPSIAVKTDPPCAR